MAKSEQKSLPVNQIRPSPVALRSVDKSKEKYVGLVDSIKSHGIINPIAVRLAKDTETGATYYSLIDGLHRYTAGIDAGLDVIPCHIVTADEIDTLEMQIIGNIHKIETKPVQYSEQLHRLLVLNPTMTAGELATRLGKSTSWIHDRLGLVKLEENIKSLVDESKINITNAYHLSKLPNDEQTNFVDRAQTMSPNQFVPTVTVRLKELRDAKRQGRQAEGTKEFVPAPFLQKISDIKNESQSKTVGRGLINQYGLTDPLDAWTMALAWVLHLDPSSIEIARQKEEERKRNLEVARAKKKEERLKKELEEAATVAAGVEDDDEE